jgi:uncharacterized protein YjbK
MWLIRNMKNSIKYIVLIFSVALFLIGCVSDLDTSTDLGHGFSINDHSLYHESNWYEIEYEDIDLNSISTISIGR